MKFHFGVIWGVFVLLVAESTWAQSAYSGNWHQTSMSLGVTLESWGDYCGPKPKSYGSKKRLDVAITTQGNHLVFSKGGIRTDRCISPNPRLKSISQVVGSTKWERTCETPPNDPKYEWVRYLFKGQGGTQLVYTAKSRFNWTLKGDHCVARLLERRVYTREQPGKKQDPVVEIPIPEAEATSEEKVDLVAEKTDQSTTTADECAQVGSIKKLLISPKKAQIGPQEKICFKLFGVDANGCRSSMEGGWKVFQDGKKINGLIRKNGCFWAGATAADAEGSYEVAVHAKGKKTTAEVIVAFPDLGDLLRARIDPLNELPQSAQPIQTLPKKTENAIAPNKPVYTNPPLAEPKAKQQYTLILVIVISIVIAILLLIIVILKKRQLKQPSKYSDNEDWLAPTNDSKGDSFVSGRDSLSSILTADEKFVVCPECKKTYAGTARFCPFDASKLINIKDLDNEPAAASNMGMVCPKCHRGYDAGAKFCPHDAEKLTLYSAWRANKRNVKQNGDQD